MNTNWASLEKARNAEPFATGHWSTDASDRKLAFAAKLREKPTKYERKLWQRLKRGFKNGIQFEPQVVIRGYIVDFYCEPLRLAIELDGPIHRKKADSLRDSQLFQAGVTVMRFRNPQSQVAVNGIASKIYAECGFRGRRSKRPLFHSDSNSRKKEPVVSVESKEKPNLPCARSVLSTRSLEVATQASKDFRAPAEWCAIHQLYHVGRVA